MARIDPPAPDGDVIHPLSAPFKPTGGLRLLRGNLAPGGGAVIKLAGVEGGMTDGRFIGRARVFDSEQALIEALATTPERFADRDMVVIRYEGPRGAPGMPEMLDPTSRITALCRQRGITIALMTDARFSGGSVGLVIGHVSPEAALGGPIALIEDGDTIVVDVNSDTLDCTELQDPATAAARRARWQDEAKRGNGIHPLVRPVDTRLLRRMRAWALPPLQGAGLSDVARPAALIRPASGRPQRRLVAGPVDLVQQGLAVEIAAEVLGEQPLGWLTAERVAAARDVRSEDDLR